MPDITPNLIARLDAMAREFAELDAQLSDPAVMMDHARVRAISVKRAALEDVVTRYRKFQALQNEIRDHESLISPAGPASAGLDSTHAELAQLAREELPGLQSQSQQLWQEIIGDLVTTEDRAIGSIILEIRAGTGGAEAALWAGDLWEMYRKFAARRGLDFTPMDFSPGDQGGLRNAIANVTGLGVWQAFGYEGGVHCVKRVPATETQGRIHTSTATVAVLPEPEKLDIEIPESDLKIDVTTAQGPGGQNVNKVATAVKMVHIPTGIEVRMQESKSQQQNRARAWQLMRARVFDHYQKLKDAQRASQRSKMIGTGERSERIRTFRYKESVVVDHRIEGSYNLAAVLDGDLDPILRELAAKDMALRLADL